MENRKKKVAIIGAGAAGLVATKCCLDEGIIPFCLEAEGHIGGQWNLKNKHHVPRNTVTNFSKELSAFSDFLYPEEFPNFMKPDMQMRYFQLYAEKFDLFKYIHLNHQVKRAEPRYCQGGQLVGWSLDYTLPSGEMERDVVFDALIVATGFNHCPLVREELERTLKGFTGEISHSHDYDDFQSFVGKRVVICGMGNSGGDIGSELSYHAKQVFLCTNVGGVILPRYGASSKIFDISNLNRITGSLPFWCTKYACKWNAAKFANNDSLGLALSDNKFALVINDEMAVRINTGTLKIHTGIERCHGKTVVLKDGGTLEDIDVIILCTGYKMEFPFLSEKYLPLQEHGKFIPLYKYMFSVPFSPFLSFIGMTKVLGSVFPIFEMQARYISAVLSGKLQLPTTEEMNLDIKKKYDFVRRTYKDNHWIEVTYVGYQDELAADLGVKPNITRTLLTDPVLGVQLLTGPPIAAQYRLHGPYSWPGARDAILTVMERVWCPMKGPGSSPRKGSGTLVILLIVLPVLICVLLYKVFHV